MINIRAINYINIDKTRSSVIVGGGILVSDFLRKFAKEELVTRTGSLSFLGYVGWSKISPMEATVP
jgi:hypothetical protein